MNAYVTVISRKREILLINLVIRMSLNSNPEWMPILLERFQKRKNDFFTNID